MNEAIERKDSYLRMMEKVPTQAYLGLALSTIAISALLRIAGKKDAALFVGQWPPTLILMALVHKLLQPSRELGFRDTSEAVAEGTHMVSPAR